MIQLSERPPTKEEIRARKARLRNPPNGRISSELEVVSTEELRRRRIAEAAAEADRRYREKNAERIMQEIMREELLAALLDAHKRSGYLAKRGPDGNLVYTAEQIINATCQHFGQSRIHVLSQRRTGPLIAPRQIIMYLARELTALSLPQIGRKLAGRDHSTVLHACRKIAARIEDGDQELIDHIAAIKRLMAPQVLSQAA